MSAQKPLVVRSSDGYASDLKLGVTLQANAARADSASINLPHGVAPTTPINGDVWTTTAGIYVRINGHTVGPLIDAASLLRVSMTVTAAWSPAAVCFVIDASMFGESSELNDVCKPAVNAALSDALTHFGASGMDVCAIAYGLDGGHTVTSITKRAASSSDITAVQSFVSGLTYSATTSFPTDGMTAAKTFFDATDAGVANRFLFHFTDGYYRSGSLVDAGTAAEAAAAGVTVAAMTGVQAFTIATQSASSPIPLNLTYLAATDNTAQDGTPAADNVDDLTTLIEQALIVSSAPCPGYLHTASGAAAVVVADAATADPTDPSFKPCNCWISEGAAAGEVVVYMPGQFVPMSGLDPGETYYLAVGGGITATPPSTSGNLDQRLGWADATGSNLFFSPERGIGA